MSLPLSRVRSAATLLRMVRILATESRSQMKLTIFKTNS
jgi:hypothetical protein